MQGSTMKEFIQPEWIELEQGSHDWLEYRRARIGASDASVIMGTVKYKSQRQLWEEKKGISSQPDTWAMRKGREAEPIARAKAEEILGMPVVPRIAQSHKYPWLMASLDGWTLDGEPLEIKMTGAEDHALVKDGYVPSKHHPQLLVQMECTGRESALFCSFHGGETVIVRFAVDKAYQTRIIHECRKWYEEFMEGGKEPPLEEVELAFRDDAAWSRLAAIGRDIHALQKEMARLREEWKEITLQESDGQYTKGCGLKVARHSGRKTLDKERLAQDAGIDISKYEKNGKPYWTVSVGERDGPVTN